MQIHGIAKGSSVVDATRSTRLTDPPAAQSAPEWFWAGKLCISTVSSGSANSKRRMRE
jgi:hypothetical protein